ncbi:winged helix-turn-helix transcriptional regulator [bacterium]|nr:winged helix-turn-helix transcriptional regulator [bacterium]
MDQCIRTFKDISQINGAKRLLKENDSSIGRLANFLNLAGNFTRLKILTLINQDDELCVCDLSDVLEMSMPAVSQHLKKLREGGVIQNRRLKQTIFYSLTADGAELMSNLVNHLKVVETERI